jgi:LysR family transcriptional regulator, pca operon transcriptional activator
LRKLRERQIDLMIGRMPQAGEMAELDFEFLYEEPIVAVLRAGHPLARLPVAELLHRIPLILPGPEAIIRRTIDDFLAALGLASLRPAVETSTLALGRGLVLATDALWFISQGVVAAEVAGGQLITVPLGASYLSGAVGMTRLAAQTPPAHLSRLIRLCRETSGNGAVGPN